MQRQKYLGRSELLCSNCSLGCVMVHNITISHNLQHLLLYCNPPLVDRCKRRSPNAAFQIPETNFDILICNINVHLLNSASTTSIFHVYFVLHSYLLIYCGSVLRKPAGLPNVVFREIHLVRRRVAHTRALSVDNSEYCCIALHYQ